MIIDKLYNYISRRFNQDGVLIDADELYEAFEVDFYNGNIPMEAIDEHIKDFANGVELEGIDIQYEGEILLPINI